MEKACPRCDKRVEFIDKTCDACGLEFPPPRPPKCPGCLRSVHPESESCGFCGLELRAPAKEKSEEGASASVTVSLSTMGWPLLGLLLMVTYANRGRLLPERPQPPSAATKKVVAAVHKVEEFVGTPADQLRSADVRRPSAFSISGVVFNIHTGKPVSNATVIFKNPDSNEFFGVHTDNGGNYLAWLNPVTAGYILTVEHRDYQPILAEDWIPSMRKLKPFSRNIIVLDLIENPPELEHIYGLPDAQLKKDYGLVPQ